MKTSTLQSLVATQAKIIRGLSDAVAEYVKSAQQMTKIGEKAYAIADYKEANFFRTKLAQAVANQKELKAELAGNNSLARIRAKGVRAFGADKEAVLFTPSITSVEIESALDEVIAIKYPKKADSRTADHPSFKKAA